METKSWKNDLIITLFQRQKMLRLAFVIVLIPVVVFLLWGYFSGLSLYRRNEGTFTWIETRCEIDYVERVGFATNNSRQYEIRYSYSYDGNDYVASRYSMSRKRERVTWDHSSESSNEYSQFTEDQKTFCYVNPASPQEAVLMRSSLIVRDYVRHFLWEVVVFTLYLFVPSLAYKKCRGNKKQLRELITGQKENILEDMNRLSEPLSDETQGFIGRMSFKHFSRWWRRGL
ncbi:MAG: DUF3592 domain-containing protein [Planctomycetota bacterium]|jgi:hypothetical protein